MTYQLTLDDSFDSGMTFTALDTETVDITVPMLGTLSGSVALSYAKMVLMVTDGSASFEHLDHGYTILMMRRD